jgi:hypothetical protein
MEDAGAQDKLAAGLGKVDQPYLRRQAGRYAAMYVEEKGSPAVIASIVAEHALNLFIRLCSRMTIIAARR